MSQALEHAERTDYPTFFAALAAPVTFFVTLLAVVLACVQGRQHPVHKICYHPAPQNHHGPLSFP